MFAQDPSQPQLFPDFNGSQPHGMLVVAVSADGIAQKISEATGHPCTQVHSSRTKNHGDSGSHIFASVLTHAFDDRQCAAIPDRKSFAYAPRHIEFPTVAP